MITISIAPLTTMYLIAIRLGTLFILSPIEAIRMLPIHARIILVLVLSMLMTSNLPALNTEPLSHFTLITASLAEFCNGLILSSSLFVAFAVFQLAGQLIDT